MIGAMILKLGARRGWDALNRGDLDYFERYLAEDVVFEQPGLPPIGGRVVGKAAWRAMMQAWIDAVTSTTTASCASRSTGRGPGTLEHGRDRVRADCDRVDGTTRVSTRRGCVRDAPGQARLRAHLHVRPGRRGGLPGWHPGSSGRARHHDRLRPGGEADLPHRRRPPRADEGEARGRRRCRRSLPMALRGARPGRMGEGPSSRRTIAPRGRCRARPGRAGS